MTVSWLRDNPGIGVDKIGGAADAAADPRVLRLENLDTDLRPPGVALVVTRAAVEQDEATQAQVAATPMTGWGPSSGRYLGLVFSKNPPNGSPTCAPALTPH